MPEDLLVEETQPRDSPAPGQQRLEAALSSQTQAWEGPQPGENRRGQNQMDTLARETLEGMVVFQHPFIPTAGGRSSCPEVSPGLMQIVWVGRRVAAPP